MCGGICSSALLLDAQTFANLGVLLKAQGHVGAAIACYRTSLRLDPRFAVQHYRMGNAYMSLNQFGMARSSYAIATSRMPKYGDAYNNLGNCLMSMSRWGEAEVAYSHAVESNPKDANYYCNLGGVVARTDIPRGIELLRTGLELNPQFGEVYNNLANYLRDQGRLGEARDAYERAMSLMPSSGEVMVNMASTQAYLCDWRRRKDTHKRLTKLTESELAEYERAIKSNAVGLAPPPPCPLGPSTHRHSASRRNWWGESQGGKRSTQRRRWRTSSARLRRFPRISRRKGACSAWAWFLQI